MKKHTPEIIGALIPLTLAMLACVFATGRAHDVALFLVGCGWMYLAVILQKHGK